MTDRAVSNHTRNCLGKEIQTLIQDSQTKNAVDVIKEFTSLLNESRDALEAARTMLTVDGKVDFRPRAWEVDIVYEDLVDRTEQGKPKLKTSPLADLLAQIEDHRDHIPIHTYVKIQDARKTYLDTIARVDGLIDRFAKLGGLYTDPKKNPEDRASAMRELAAHIATTGIMVSPELAQQVVGELYGDEAPVIG
jgi:hypothetical protein